MRSIRRVTDIEISTPAGETGQIYEMGIPIQAVDMEFDINILQKVPMPPNRDTVAESYLKRVYRLVLDQVHQDLEGIQFSENWVRAAMEDPEISDEAVQNTLTQRYGEKVVTWSSNQVANMEALDHGYQVLHPKTFSKPELENLRQKGGLQSANAIFNNRLNNAVAVDEGESTQARKDFARWVKEIGAAANFQIKIKFIKDEGARHTACCSMNSANPKMEFNTHYLDEAFFTGRGPAQLALIIHELGHAEANGAAEHGPTWGKSCATVGGRIAASALEATTMSKPFFLAVEGTDKSGKTSATTELTKALLQKGVKTTLLQEPGSTQVGDIVRKIFQDKLPTEPLTEVLLFEAARHQMVQTRVLPALNAGYNVITARFTTSTLAYQGHARGVDLELIDQLNRTATGGLKPDLTVILDVPIATARQRGPRGSDSFETQADDFFEKVRQGYLATARDNPQNHRIINATAPAELVIKQLIEIADSLLQN